MGAMGREAEWLTVDGRSRVDGRDVGGGDDLSGRIMRGRIMGLPMSTQRDNQDVACHDSAFHDAHCNGPQSSPSDQMPLASMYFGSRPRRA